MRTPTVFTVCAAWLLALLPGPAHAAIPSSDVLLPAETTAYLSIGNWEGLQEHWNQTQLSGLFEDPAMEPFTEDLKRQLDERFALTDRRLGLSLEDLEGIPNGEVALGFIYAGHGEPVLVMLVDITDNIEAAREQLQEARAELEERGATRTTQDVGDAEIVIYDVPEDEDHEGGLVAYVLHGDLLAAADDPAALADVLERLEGDAEGTLSTVTAYQATMQRCRTAAGEIEPDIRWFIDPFALADAVSAAAPPEDRRSADMVRVLKKTGFTAVQGIGGFLNAAAEGFEFVHRTMIYAPPPYEQAMKMLVFPNGHDLTPQIWVPTDVATLHCDILNAFDNFDPLFDALFGEGPEDEGLWQDVLESLRTDPYGPMIDLREELIKHMGTRVSLISDYELPITTTSQRRLLAIEAADEEALARGIRKSLEVDENVRQVPFRDHIIWEVMEPEPTEAPYEVNITIEGLEEPGLPPAGGAAEEDEEMAAIPNSAVCVAHGHLFLGSHVSIVEEVIAKAEDDPNRLDETVDYQEVISHADRVGGTGGSVLVFSRLDEELRANYELFRMGQLPMAETGLAQMLNSMLGPTEPGAPPREAELDASKLPDFQVVRRYLGPTAAYVQSEADGWFVVGYVLTRQPEHTEAAALSVDQVPQ